MPMPQTEAPGALQTALLSRGIRMTRQRRIILENNRQRRHQLDARRQRAGGGEDADAREQLPQPGQHPQRFRREPAEHHREQHPRDAGGPEGLYVNLSVQKEAAPAIIADVRIRAITVTGSFRRWESVMWVCCLTSLLTRPIWSVTRKIGMFTLRAYLLIAVILLVIKTVQLATEH